MTAEWLHRAVLRRVPVRGTAKAVLIALADRLDGRKSYQPSLDELAADSGLTVPTVRKAIDLLAEEGWITVDKGRGRSVRNRYQLAEDRIRAAPLLVPDRLGHSAAGGGSHEGVAPPETPAKTESSLQEPYPENCKFSTEKLKAACTTGTKGTQKVEEVTRARDAGLPDLDAADVAPSAKPNPPPETEVCDKGEIATWREQLLQAMGHAPPGITAAGRVMLDPAQMVSARRWETDLGLHRSEILAVIEAVMARKRDGPPRSLAYFEEPMRRLAAEKARPRLTPKKGDENEPYHAHAGDRVVAFRPANRPDPALENSLRLAGIEAAPRDVGR